MRFISAFGYKVLIGALCLSFSIFLTLANIAQAQTSSKKIIILGDSLTAGYGIEEQYTLPVRLEEALREVGHDITVVNAGVSGDTTAGGLERLEWVMAEPADFLAIALGANDGLRGIDPQSSRENLEKIIIKAREINQDIKVLLIGMLAPPNLGQEYADTFNAMYPELSARYDVPLYPFILEGVVADASLNQKDGIHPNAKGVEVMIENMVPFFLKYMSEEPL